MAKTDLSEEEQKTIIEALNNNVELPPELMTKLFPVWRRNLMLPNCRQKDNLLDEVEARMQQQIKIKELFRIHWKLA